MAGAKIAFTEPIIKSGEQDGPGLRTCVFFKGCPLRCKWCSYPESQNLQPELAVFTSQCIRCGQFERFCPDVWRSEENTGSKSPVFNEYAWRATVCPGGGVRRIGERISAANVMAEVQRDASFYLEDGGITLTGGEPLFQSEMAEALLRLAQTE
jgi:pyruvate formate lyase activating enzyme